MSPTIAIWIGLAINIAANIVAIALAYMQIRERLTRIETQLQPLWRAYERRRGTSGTGGVHP